MMNSKSYKTYEEARILARALHGLGSIDAHTQKFRDCNEFYVTGRDISREMMRKAYDSLLPKRDPWEDHNN